MAEILVAASSGPRAIVERILAGHALFCAETLAQAEQFLRERPFDLILCTIVFDKSRMFDFLRAESRMFDFLRRAKARREWQQIPFVCARVSRHMLNSPFALQGIALTCQALGAVAFLNITDYQGDPEREMRAAIERLLDTTARRDP